METLPNCCLPIARVLTTSEQLQQHVRARVYHINLKSKLNFIQILI